MPINLRVSSVRKCAAFVVGEAQILVYEVRDARPECKRRCIEELVHEASILGESCCEHLARKDITVLFGWSCHQSVRSLGIQLPALTRNKGRINHNGVERSLKRWRDIVCAVTVVEVHVVMVGGHSVLEGIVIELKED